MVKQLPLIPLLEQFIKETKSGKRRKPNGERISAGSLHNYFYVLKHTQAYEKHLQTTFRITANIRNNQRLILQENEYWKDFYRGFTDYLLYTKGYYDNFVGSIFKTLKCFFRYLKNEKYLQIQECFERFYVRRVETRVISLLPQQFCFLILNEAFEAGLPTFLKRCKDQFVFGCTAALRYSDLKSLRVMNVEQRCGCYYLIFHSIKTDTPVQVKLPPFAIEIYRKYARHKKPGAKLFPCIAAANFDKALKKLGERAGWTEVIGKERTKNGTREEVKQPNKRSYRFCDQLSSHLMRKTGVTVLLMLGMPEHLVRKVSGHAAHSREFYRYVNFAQSYITDELDKAHQKLLSLYQA